MSNKLVWLIGLFLFHSCSSTEVYSKNDLVGDWKSTKEELFFMCSEDDRYLIYENPKTKSNVLNHDLKYEISSSDKDYKLVTFFLDKSGNEIDKSEFDLIFFTKDSIQLTPILKNATGVGTSFVRVID